MTRSSRLSRRTFLRGATAALALPLLDAMSPLRAGGEVGEAPRRMVFVYVPNGVNVFRWTPQGEGTDFALSPTLEPLAALKEDVTVLTGLGHPKAKGGHSGGDTWLTGADLQGTPGYDYRNSVSADQLAAEVVGLKTRLPSLELSSHGGTGPPGHSHTLAFNRNGVPVATEKNPRLVFERLFVDDAGASRRARLRRFAEDRSILDEVLDQSRALQRRLGAGDRRKLDEYFQSVREVERRVKQAEGWADVPKAKVDAGALKLDARPDERGDRKTYLRVMYDLIFLALQTDTTRVVTFVTGREAAGGYFTELGLSASHHELSHHGGDKGMLESLGKIDRFHVEQLAYFLNRLKSAREGGGTLLDRTMVLYGSGMNSGEGGGHSPKNLPLLLAGGRGLGIRQGQHLKFEPGRVPLSNVLLTMLRGMDLPQERFQDSTGTVGELLG
ncbi:MAG TPA: DUF1552 domain-containing protein [Gemmataceae bacterium]